MTTPILDRIPDVSHQPPRRQVTIGLFASIAVHALLLLFGLLIAALLPEPTPLNFAKSQPKLQEIELTIMEQEDEEEPPAIPLVQVPEVQPVLDSQGLAASEQAPERPLFESDVNMLAASEIAPLGNLPLPSQEGRTDLNFLGFSNQRSSLGSTAAPFSLDVAPPSPPIPAAEQAPPAPEKTPPTATPAPVLAKLETPTKTTPLPEVTQPGENQIAIAPKPVATPAEVRPPVIMPRLRAEIREAAAPTPAPKARASGYQAHDEKTRIEGNITNRGRNAVDAKGTPLGRYNAVVGRTIGSRWNYYIKSAGSTVSVGSVRVHFSIDQHGRISDVRSEDNTGNPSLAAVCERAVLESEVAPPSPELAETLPDGKLDITFTFTLY